ncbi:hypothetical protein [Peptococcus simiae]|uniref:hypothetical protein n=1 Tax=Peptococcus simiae TaxID=1643805 RepID=UPI00397EB3E4
MAKLILTVEMDSPAELTHVSQLLVGKAPEVRTTATPEPTAAPEPEPTPAPTPAPAAPTETPVPGAEKISLEDLQRAFRQKRTKENAQLLKEIVQAHGGARLSEVPEDRRPALMAELDALVVG